MLVGLAVALMDSSRGFDATGITAAGLIVGGAVAAFIDGSGSFAWAALLTLLVGAWVPVLESQVLPASALPLLFAAIGAFAAALSRRLVLGASPPDGGFTVH